MLQTEKKPKKSSRKFTFSLFINNVIIIIIVSSSSTYDIESKLISRSGIEIAIPKYIVRKFCGKKKYNIHLCMETQK